MARDWCPGKRGDVLLMCKTWITVLNEDTENSKGDKGPFGPIVSAVIH